jgi:GTP cyclohydrolase II
MSDMPVPTITRYAETLLPTVHGPLRCVVFRAQDGTEHVAMVAGDISGDDVLCRVHSECLTSEVLGSLKCDCKQQLDRALDLISRRGRGVVLYLRQEGRGIGLGNKIRAYALQEEGYDTVDANRALGLPDDARDYRVAAEMLADLGVKSVALLTNNPLKVDGLEEAGVKVSRRVPHLVTAPGPAKSYLEVKGRRMGHLLTEDWLDEASIFVAAK